MDAIYKNQAFAYHFKHFFTAPKPNEQEKKLCCCAIYGPAAFFLCSLCNLCNLEIIKMDFIGPYIREI